MIANYYLDPFLTYNMTLSTFRYGPQKISCISILINAKVSTLMGEINQVLLSRWTEMKFLLSTASKTWVFMCKAQYHGKVGGCKQVEFFWSKGQRSNLLIELLGSNGMRSNFIVFVVRLGRFAPFAK